MSSLGMIIIDHIFFSNLNNQASCRDVVTTSRSLDGLGANAQIKKDRNITHTWEQTRTGAMQISMPRSSSAQQVRGRSFVKGTLVAPSRPLVAKLSSMIK